MRSLPVLLALVAATTTASAQEADAIADAGGGTALEVDGIDVTGGSLLLGRASYVKAGTGRLAVLSGVIRTGSPFGRAAMKGGSLTFDNASTFRTDGSTLSIHGGNLEFRGDSKFLGDGSSISVSGGSILTFDGSALRLGDGGSITFGDSTRTTFGDSTITVNGGGMEYRGKASGSIGNGSSLTIRGGDFILSDASSFEVTGGSMNVNDGSMHLRPGTGLVFSRGAHAQVSRVDVQSGGDITWRAGARANFSGSAISLDPRASLRIAEEGELTGGRGTTLTVPDRAIGFDDLAVLDTACDGTALVSINEKGSTTLACERPAKEGEACAGYRDPVDGTWVCQDSCAKTSDRSPKTCDRKVGICCRE